MTAECDIYADDNACKPFMDAPIRSTLKQIGQVRGKRILIIGCGSQSIIAEYFAVRGAQVVAIDLSFDALRISSARPGGVHYIQADAVALPLEPSSFDITFSVSTLQYMQIPLAIEACRRILRPSGLAVFIENLASCPTARADRLRRRLRRSPEPPTMTIRRHLSWGDIDSLQSVFSSVNVTLWHDWTTMLYPLLHGQSSTQKLLKSIVRKSASPFSPNEFRARFAWLAEIECRKSSADETQTQAAAHHTK